MDLICLLAGKHPLSLAHQVDNAAAPELLAVLHELLDHGIVTSPNSGVVGRALRIIDKAEGRPS